MKGFGLRPHEDFHAIIKNAKKISTDEKIILRDILIANAASAIFDDFVIEFFNLVVERLNKMNRIKWIEPVLKVVATSDDLKIITDFDQDSVHHIDPTATKGIKGICLLCTSLVFLLRCYFAYLPDKVFYRYLTFVFQIFL